MQALQKIQQGATCKKDSEWYKSFVEGGWVCYQQGKDGGRPHVLGQTVRCNKIQFHFKALQMCGCSAKKPTDRVLLSYIFMAGCMDMTALLVHNTPAGQAACCHKHTMLLFRGITQYSVLTHTQKIKASWVK